jgi:cytochrome c2
MKKPTRMEVVRRAYELWQKAGQPEGRDQEFYHQAERELGYVSDAGVAIALQSVRRTGWVSGARPPVVHAVSAARHRGWHSGRHGPELNGLDGRHSGTAEGYSYSDANKNSGITWNEAQFKDYIKDPKAKIPGTKMVFAGIKNEKEAGDLWAFLAQYDKDGKTK